MRIVEISIEGLFGTFNHKVSLNKEDRITIIHSPNGFGKTAILRLIHAIFSGNSSVLTDIPYKKITIEFSNDTSLVLRNLQGIIQWTFAKRSKISKGTNLKWTQIKEPTLKITEIIKSIKTLFISVERLKHESVSYGVRSEIEDKTKEYIELAQSLETTYPIRLIEKKNAFELNNLKEKLNKIEEKQKELVSAGLLDVKSVTNTSFIDKVDDSNSKALSLYVEDMSEKLAVFDELEEKVEILKDIINSRFLYKKMLVRKGRGIYFVNDEGIELSFNNLSSGEQHELVLFYELLFDTTENTLILIDEPEISLHVVWQNQFLKDLVRVAKNAKFDVLLATHSPQIIADRWDLTVELKGKEKSANFNGNGKRNSKQVKV